MSTHSLLGGKSGAPSVDDEWESEVIDDGTTGATPGAAASTVIANLPVSAPMPAFSSSASPTGEVPAVGGHASMVARAPLPPPPAMAVAAAAATTRAPKRSGGAGLDSSMKRTKREPSSSVSSGTNLRKEFFEQQSGAPCIDSGGIKFYIVPKPAIKIPGSERFRV
mmetsp:Transcript_11663/g.29948  ORF Transcript_11663/g.29948 Transcript_11663/m.29948 type:complete len:166 (+) Transcript_11663:141-638(+)